MIEVKPYLLFLQSRQKILNSFWKMRPGGTAEEINATARKVETERAKIRHAIDQLRQYPQSGQLKGGERRRIVVSDSRYVITYQISKTANDYSYSTFETALENRVSGSGSPSPEMSHQSDW